MKQKQTAIAYLITAPEEINPLLEILWQIEQQERQGQQLIEPSDIELESLTESVDISRTQTMSMSRSLDILKRASPIAAPGIIRGF
jgi:hypothetical protein